MTQRLPFTAHHPQTRASLLAHFDAAHGHCDGGVAHLLFPWLQQVFITAEAVAGVPELDTVREELDHRLPRMVAIVLVDQQVHCRFAEHTKPGRCVTAFQSGRINVAERLRHEEEVFGQQLLPALNDVFLADEAIDPARLRHLVLAAVAQKSHIQNRARQQVAHTAQRAKQRDAAARRQQLATILDEIAPLIEEVVMRLLHIKTRIGGVKAIPIPLQAAAVQRLGQINTGEGLPIPAVGGGITQQTFDVELLRPVVTTTLANEGAADVTIQIHRLARARVLGNMEGQHGFAVVQVAVLRHLHIVAHLAAGMEHGQQIILQLVRLGHAADVEPLTRLRYPQHQPATVCIGESRDRLERRLGQGIAGGLEFGGAPFALA